jgi:citronellol/citronellal dehydrogenase
MYKTETEATCLLCKDIDILVNNASAISLTGTVETSMKKYDLMNQVNGRGTYLW